MSFLAKSPDKSKLLDSRLTSKSPLLFSVLDKFDPDRCYQILDTGPASGDTINTFSRFRCKLHVTNSSGELCTLDTDKLVDADKLNRALAKSLSFDSSNNTGLDLILLWDLPNYCHADVLSAIMTYLLAWVDKETVLHCYIHTASMMPDTPGRYAIMEDGLVRVDYDTNDKRPCPAYYQEALHKLMHPFRVKRSILHTNGIQEYLLGQ